MKIKMGTHDLLNKKIKIDDELIEYLENSCYFTVSQEEKPRLVEELQNKVNSLAVLIDLDTTGVPECNNPITAVNAFREDEVIPSFDRELILQNAPVRNDEAIIAPRIV